MEGQQTISELAEGVTKEMERLQFSPLTIRAFRLDVRNLRKYVQEKTGSDFFSEEIGASYLRERFDFPPENPRTLTNTERAGIRCVRRLGEYKAYGLIMRNKTPAEREWQLDDKNLISAYVEAMQTADNSERTKKRRMQDIRSFYDYMSVRGLSGAREVSAQIISDYIVTLQGYSPVYNKHRLTTLRNYFRFLTASGFLETDWSQSVPTVVAATNRTIPALWEKSEIECLLSNIDRGNPRHLRYVWVELGCPSVRSTRKGEWNPTETKQNHGNQVFNVAESVGHTNGEFDLVVCGFCTSVRKAVSNR